MQFDELNQETLDWLVLHLANAPDFIRTYSPVDGSRQPSIESLDRAWAGFMQLNMEDDTEVNKAINIVGLSLGQHLVENAGFEWTIVTDEYGTELAIVALRGAGDVVVCPASFVSKRWERKETDFLANAVEQICDTKARIEKQWNENN